MAAQELTRAERRALALADQVWHQPAVPAPPVARSPRWYIVQTEPGREKTAQQQIGVYSFESYLPVIAVFEQRGRFHQRRIRPMFPGYLFVRLDLAVDRHDRIRLLPGIQAGERAFMRKPGGSYATLREAEVVRIVEAQSVSLGRRKPTLPFHKGQLVELTAGPFAGIVGVIDRLDDVDRISVLIAALGRETPVRVSASGLRTAESGG